MHRVREKLNVYRPSVFILCILLILSIPAFFCLPAYLQIPFTFYLDLVPALIPDRAILYPAINVLVKDVCGQRSVRFYPSRGAGQVVIKEIVRPAQTFLPHCLAS